MLSVSISRVKWVLRMLKGTKKNYEYAGDHMKLCVEICRISSSVRWIKNQGLWLAQLVFELKWNNECFADIWLHRAEFPGFMHQYMRSCWSMLDISRGFYVFRTRVFYQSHLRFTFQYYTPFVRVISWLGSLAFVTGLWSDHAIKLTLQYNLQP